MIARFASLTLSLLAAFALAACSQGTPAAVGVDAPDGFAVTVFASGFVGPTQMVFGPDGDLFIAQLNGAENDAAGQVLRIDASDPAKRVVLQSGLDKPTGIAVAGDTLWIMERRRLLITTLEPNAPLQVVADELPFNGRSEGTLTVTPDGSVLYNTSGSKRGAVRVADSGTIFAIENAAQGPSEPQVIATGFKHAYAHLVDPDGQLWSVEMTDGTFDGDRAGDELVAVRVGDDAGWPQCVDNNRPVIEFGGTPDICETAPRSHALFAPGATPTSFVIAPWDPDVFIVALWLPGRVVQVPRTAPTGEPHGSTDFIGGIESPQHLLVNGDGLLLSDHETGQIFAIAPAR